MASGSPDPVAIARSLGFEPIEEPSRVTGGQDAAIWGVHLEDGSSHALRVVSATREIGFNRGGSSLAEDGRR